MRSNDNLSRIFIALFFVVFILLRFWNLTGSCLWFDELFSVHAAEQSWRNIFSFVAQDLIHPPLFYVLLKLWISVGGENLYFLRIFPALFAIVSLIPFSYLCRQLKFEFPSFVLALAFFTFNGALIKYSQEVRMYSLLLCLSLFSIWLFVRFLDLGKNIWILTIINFLLVYTHYFGWLVVITEILAILYFQRIKIRQILTMFGIVLAAYIPWILMIFRSANINADLGQNIGWIERPNLFVLVKSVLNFLEPFYFQQSNVEPISNFLFSIPLLIVLFTGIAFYFAGWKDQSETDKRNFLFLLIFTKIPAWIVFIASWILPFSFWGTRHLIILFAPTAILLSLMLNKVELKPLKYLIFSVLAIIFAGAFLFQIQRPKPQFIWCAWEKLAENIDKDQARKIYVFEDLVAYHFWFAFRDTDKILVVRVKDVPEMIEDKAYFLPRGFDQVETADANVFNENRFYVAFRDMKWNEFHPPLNILKEKGYKIGTPKEIDVNGLKAFLVEVSK
ncbi:MAG: glycosyltransferase family 39 protein [Pyrinomonadaceae bacterium]|nr:glycosyltransferase family 39 protein [Pyrinomonadaceae bacterium]